MERDIDELEQESHLLALLTPFQRSKIRPSNVPFKALYNPEIKSIKNTEQFFNLAPRPVSFIMQKGVFRDDPK